MVQFSHKMKDRAGLVRERKKEIKERCVELLERTNATSTYIDLGVFFFVGVFWFEKRGREERERLG